MRFVEVCGDQIYTQYVTGFSSRRDMRRVMENCRAFKTFRYARYATDVTFKQANRPMGNMAASKTYYSGTQKLYGYKVEVSVVSIGIDVGCSQHFAGFVSDIDIFHQMQDFHNSKLRKVGRDNEIANTGMLEDSYPES